MLGANIMDSASVQSAMIFEVLGMLTHAELSEAKRIGRDLKQPMEKVFVMSNFLTEQQVCLGLQIQRMLTTRQIDLNIAKQAAALVTKRGMTLDAALCQCGWVRQELGTVKKTLISQQPNLEARHLLAEAGIIDKAEVQKKLGVSLMTETTIEDLLINSNLVTKELLNAAIQLQKMVGTGTLTTLTAVEALRKVYTRGVSVQQAVAEMGLMRSNGQKKVRVGELLKIAGFVTPAQVEEALRLSTWNDMLIGKIMVVCGMIEEKTLQAALECQYLVREGVITMDQAVVVLHFCHRVRCSADEAVSQLGYNAAATQSPTESVAPTPADARISFTKLNSVLTDSGCFKGLEKKRA